MSVDLELGKLELISGPGKGFLYFGIVLFILCTAICGFVYFKTISIGNSGKSLFNGDISTSYKVMAGIIALGSAILVVSMLLTKGTAFYFYEKGIVAVDKRNQKTTLYTDIQDLFLYTAGNQIYEANNVAYRNNEGTDWQVISAKNSNYDKAVALIRTRQQQANVPKMLQQLNEGKSITFHYIDYPKVVTTNFLAKNIKSYLNVKPKTIVLYKNKLIIDHETIYLDDVQHFSANDWISQIKLLNKENKPIFTVGFYSVFSGNSFIAVLDELINKQLNH